MDTVQAVTTRGYAKVPRLWSDTEAAELLRAVNVGGSVAMEALASILEQLPQDGPRPSCYLLCEQVRETVDAEDWGGGPHPALPDCHPGRIVMGWGRSRVVVAQHDWSEFARWRIELDVTDVLEAELAGHDRVLAYQRFAAAYGAESTIRNKYCTEVTLTDLPGSV